MNTLRNLFFITLGLLLLDGPLRAADQSDADARMREALRNTVLQLRDAQNQVATLQTAQIESDQKNKDLTGQIELLKKHSADDKTVADKTTATLNAKLSDQNAEIAQLRDALEKYKTAYGRAVTIAQEESTQHVKLDSENLELQRRLSDCQSKNVELFKLGNEILGRYEDFGLGNALAAKEPFVGVTRVKLENLVQDYEDKLLAQRVKP